ncbi:26S proteasome non-ATPase regulatory subunit [Fasciola gigantica]|uniref:26S proteasome non-ATPase regulatory subunit n=1 Tax=Fasciola gigantica TaxID=46835 RepID=A0A504Z113_FASGI|nr:26S proteasome non-ATPase regulatory subunit [Fasciola gigantica]
MSDGRLQKMDVDYSSTVDELIPVVKSLAQAGNIDGALEQCAGLEKQTRMVKLHVSNPLKASDAISTGRLLEVMVEILAEGGKWEQLNRHLETMTKKRNQLKQAVTKMVQKVLTYLDTTPDEETKLALIASLRNVTEGKIYVEVERARLTRELARIKESHGQIDEAASVLQELQVETFGSMEKKEKVEFMLEQIRLGLAKKDYIRTQIISRKISPKFFADGAHEELKLKYYHLMIELNLQDDQYLNISKHYWEVYNTKSIQEDEAKRLLALKHVIVYLLLAKYDNEQHDLMCRRKILGDMEKIPAYLEMLKAFTTQELLRWDDFQSQYGPILHAETDVFSTEKSPERAEKRWGDLHSRLVEHNIRVIAEYYTKIRLQRMAQLLDLDTEKAEQYLSEMVVNKTIIAKIDRLEGVVHFTETKTPTEVLNDWSYNTRSLMTLINQATHLINKERVLHAM